MDVRGARCDVHCASPNGSPIGMAVEIRRFSVRGAPPHAAKIVGVVSDPPPPPGQQRTLPAIYLPFGSDPARASSAPRPFSVYIRSTEPGSLVGDFRRIVTAAEPREPWTKLDTAGALVADETGPTRIAAASLGGLGLVALLLAATGIYAVMAYVVSLRTQEIGIRMAIGARPADVTRLVLGATARLVGVGLGGGLMLTLPTAYALRGIIEGVSFIDPISLVPTVGLLMVVAMLAAVIPARRAASLDPVTALRSE
jgi:putative ABC transport system permease protein